MQNIQFKLNIDFIISQQVIFEGLKIKKKNQFKLLWSNSSAPQKKKKQDDFTGLYDLKIEINCKRQKKRKFYTVWIEICLVSSYILYYVQ